MYFSVLLKTFNFDYFQDESPRTERFYVIMQSLLFYIKYEFFSVNGAAT